MSDEKPLTLEQMQSILEIHETYNRQRIIAERDYLGRVRQIEEDRARRIAEIKGEVESRDEVNSE